ncbi:MAG: RNA-directed DNA polymerase [Polyangiaceae bacterium]
MIGRNSIELALRNIARFGDTDVFPFALETAWFHDAEPECVGLLEECDKHFDDWIREYPFLHVKSLTSVGYAGFRAATQIDPIWNAYLLALVVEIGPDLERARVPVTKEMVFSYRYVPGPDTHSLFDTNLGWVAFQSTALARASAQAFVLATDISDFYPRIYHHRLENALQQATERRDIVNRIIVLLAKFSQTSSYGLPVGGNAARVLAELLLNRVDRLLVADKIDFVRFVDDYYVFADSREAAQRALVFLSETLLENEGLGLSRAKTRLMTRAEFLRSSPIAEPDVAESEVEAEARRFLKIRLAYDQYSPTADDDYDLLEKELAKFDVLAMLAREFGKSRVDEALVRQLLKAVRFLEPAVRQSAVESIVNNLGLLYPVFPTVAILLRKLLPELKDVTRELVFERFRALVARESHITLVPANLAFAIRVLAYDKAEDTDVLFIQLYNRPRTDMMIKRDIILAMTRRRVSYWLSDTLKRYAVLTPWERRALLVSCYVLTDEGKHWRESVKKDLSLVDAAFMRWVAHKYNGRIWDIPL